ncbi:MAG: hypothetical protein ACTSSJ_05155 [Candidatus Odinarchaeia archaeon]
MGVKGWLGFKLKTKKISLEIFQAFYMGVIDHLIVQYNSDIPKVNDALFKIGENMAEYLLTEYSAKIKKHALKFPEFKKTLSLAYKVFTGVDFSEAKYDPETDTIIFAAENCPICGGVENISYQGLKYCNMIPGIFSKVLELRGFSGTASEVECKVSGEKACKYVVKKLE